jgi:hypothetical protein
MSEGPCVNEWLMCLWSQPHLPWLYIPNLNYMVFILIISFCRPSTPLTPPVLWFKYEMSPTHVHTLKSWSLTGDTILRGSEKLMRWGLVRRHRSLEMCPWELYFIPRFLSVLLSLFWPPWDDQLCLSISQCFALWPRTKIAGQPWFENTSDCGKAITVSF